MAAAASVDMGGALRALAAAAERGAPCPFVLPDTVLLGKETHALYGSSVSDGGAPAVVLLEAALDSAAVLAFLDEELQEHRAVNAEGVYAVLLGGVQPQELGVQAFKARWGGRLPPAGTAVQAWAPGGASARVLHEVLRDDEGLLAHRTLAARIVKAGHGQEETVMAPAEQDVAHQAAAAATAIATALGPLSRLECEFRLSASGLCLLDVRGGAATPPRPASPPSRPRTAAELEGMHKQRVAALGEARVVQHFPHVVLDRSKTDATGRPLDARDTGDFMAEFLTRIASEEGALLAPTGSAAASAASAAAGLPAPLRDATAAAWATRLALPLAALRDDALKTFAVTARAAPPVQRLFALLGLLLQGAAMPWQTAVRALKAPTAFRAKLEAWRADGVPREAATAALALVAARMAESAPDALLPHGAVAAHLAHWAVLAAFAAGQAAGLEAPAVPSPAVRR